MQSQRRHPQRSLLTALAVWALLAVALAPAISFAQAVRIPRTTITVTPPPGFKVSRTFSGLENTETGSQIMLAESPPEAHDEIVKVFSSPRTISTRYASQGVRIMRIEQVMIDEGQIPLAIGGKAQNGKEVATYISTLGGPATSTMAVLATFSINPLDTLTRADVETVLRSIKLARVLSVEEKVAKLAFTFEAAEPFRVTNVQDASATLTSAEDQGSVEKTPMIIINRALTRSAPGEIAALSETLLRGINGFREAPIAERSEVEFAGGRGYLASAAAGELTALQIVRILPGGRYIRFVARGETATLEAARETLMKIAGSVAFKE